MSVEKLLLAKLEAIYYTDPTHDDSNAIETIGLGMMRYEGDKVSRYVDRHTLGGKPTINVNSYTQASFSVPAASWGRLAPRSLHPPMASSGAPVASTRRSIRRRARRR